MAIRRAYLHHNKIRLEIITAQQDIQMSRGRPFSPGSQTSDWPGRRLTLFSGGELECVSGKSRRSTRPNPAWKLRVTCRQSWIALKDPRSSRTNANGGPEQSGRRFAFGRAHPLRHSDFLNVLSTCRS